MTKILLVGTGSMGTALLKGWMQSEKEYDVHLLSPHAFDKSKELEIDQDHLHQSPDDVKNLHPDFAVFALKPQILLDIIPQFEGILTPKTTCISIAAGTPLLSLVHKLNSSPWVRVMPNISSTVGYGVSALYSDHDIPKNDKNTIEELFACVGKAFWVETEDTIDKITAISGSGPAYFFQCIEYLAMAAIDLGFSADEAEELAKDTFLGAAALLHEEGTPESLTQRVTSPGGTTEAALNIFNSAGLSDTFKEAVNAAYRRAKEISKKNSPY